MAAVGDYRPVLCLSFDVRFYFFDSLKNLFSRTCVLANIECIFSAKSCSLGNLSLLNNFQKLLTDAGMGNRFGWRSFCEGRVKRIDRQIYLAVLRSLRQMNFQDNERRGTEKHRVYPYRCPSG